MEMCKKYIVYVLIPSILIQLAACYSMQEIAKDEMASLKVGGDLIINTKYSSVYFFEESHYHIANDSIYGKGFAKYSDATEFKLVNEGAVAFNDIERLQQEELNIVTSGLLVGGILFVVIVGIVMLFGDSQTGEVIVIPTY